ncbi:MAG: hypothetical protein M1831_000416 [Alyxoria varia]|nr:MAG: hypothetical protein M1831_000416 [Alyxoria varia]
MGNDGGSIPSRRELVKEAARNPTATQLKETRQEQQDHLWRTDSLTNRPLAQPVVSDALGRLFNKDSIIEFLLPSESPEDAGGAAEAEAKKTEQEHILKGIVKGLKDVVEVKFQVEDDGESVAAKGQGLRSNGIAREEKWVCPVTNKELGASTKAVYLVPCGHAFAQAAVKEVSGEKCLQCNESYASNDVIPILSTDETDIAHLTLRMDILKERGLAHSLKKASGKKRKNSRADRDELQVATADDSAKVSNDNNRETSERSLQNDSIKNANTASLTAKIIGEQEARNKRRKMHRNENLDSLFAARDSSHNAPKDGTNRDFMTRGYAVNHKR